MFCPTCLSYYPGLSNIYVNVDQIKVHRYNCNKIININIDILMQIADSTIQLIWIKKKVVNESQGESIFIILHLNRISQNSVRITIP